MSALREALQRAGLADKVAIERAEAEARKRAEEAEHRRREAAEAEEAATGSKEKVDAQRSFLPPEEWSRVDRDEEP